MDTTIIDQMNKLLINCFDFSDFIKPGKIRIKTAIKKNAGTICSKVIF